MKPIIVRATGDLRRATADYIAKNHYMRSAGGSGQLFAVLQPDTNSVVGACLIGATVSENQKNSIVGACLIGPSGSPDVAASIIQETENADLLIRVIKRSHLLDDVDMYESHLLRTAMQQVTDEYGKPVLYISYADLGATDERTGNPLAGWVYLASGFFYIGETTGKRFCVIDHNEQARSTRQGNITLTRKTLPKSGDVFHGEHITKNWRMCALPPARIWIAITTPSTMTQRQAKKTYRKAWASLRPDRRVAAKKWIDHIAWQKAQDNGIVAIQEPRAGQIDKHQRMQPAWWTGQEMTRTAAPVWVPLWWQNSLLDELTVEGETTARRTYCIFQS